MPINNPSQFHLSLKARWQSYVAGRGFWVLAGILLILPIVFFYLIFYTTWRDVASGSANLRATSLQQDIASLRQKYELRKAHQAELNKFSLEDRTRFSRALPPTAEVPEILVQLEALLTHQAVSTPKLTVSSTSSNDSASSNPTPRVIPRASLEEAGPGAELQTNALSLDFSVASYEQLKAVVAALQSNLRLIDILKLSYDPQRQTANIEARVYHLP
jgi:hypothetical protein